MTIILNKQILERATINLGEALFLIAMQNEIVFTSENGEIEKSLMEKGYIDFNYKLEGVQYVAISHRITKKGFDKVEELISLMPRVDNTMEDEQLEELATKLKAIFPTGKKEGTNLQWTEGKALIVRRLKLFFRKYGTFPIDDILEAAQAYVSSFNGMYSYMRTLKYFIWKEEKGAGGEIEPSSDLLNYLENKGQEETLSDDWMSEVI